MHVFRHGPSACVRANPGQMGGASAYQQTLHAQLSRLEAREQTRTHLLKAVVARHTHDDREGGVRHEKAVPLTRRTGRAHSVVAGGHRVLWVQILHWSGHWKLVGGRGQSSEWDSERHSPTVPGYTVPAQRQSPDGWVRDPGSSWLRHTVHRPLYTTSDRDPFFA